jgi:hypothetical protein
VAWLDAGDCLAPGSLYAVGQTFLLHDAHLVVGRCARVLERQAQVREIQSPNLPFGRIEPLPLGELLDLDRGWLPRKLFLQPGVFLTRAAFDRAGGCWREGLRDCLDYDLWVRLARAGARAFALPEVLAIMRDFDQPEPADAVPAGLAELRAVNAAYRAAGQTSIA